MEKRVIKFRAWDGKKMLYLPDHWWCNEYGSLGFTAPELGICGFSHEDFDYVREPEPDIMQFTGLSDKNGREIYEGDIVQIRSFLGEIIDTCTVEYKLHSFNYFPLGKPEQALYYAQDSVEVVGNIHENPDLLINQ